MPAFRRPFVAVPLRGATALLLPLLLVLLACPPVRADRLENLGALWEDTVAVSGDGLTVVHGRTGGPFYINDGGRPFAFGALTGLTADGSMILARRLGVQTVYSGDDHDTATLLAGGGVWADLAELNAISPDGRALAGRDARGHARLWITDHRWNLGKIRSVVLPTAVGPGGWGAARDVSAPDAEGGRVVVGADGDRPVAWSVARDGTGVRPRLRVLDHDGFDRAVATRVSRDGRVAIGQGFRAGRGVLALKWDTATGALVVLDRDGHACTEARAVSADGTVIVGTVTGADRMAVRWTGAGADYTLRKLGDVLRGRGLDMGNWYLRTADGVSDDGTVIVGTGFDLADGGVSVVLVNLARCRVSPLCPAHGTVRTARAAVPAP